MRAILLLAVLAVGCGLLPTETKIRYRDRPCPECPSCPDSTDKDHGRDR